MHVGQLWRYPVKSFGGERLQSATIETDGLRGDHVWAVVDAESGAVASAKKFRRFGVLLTCGARLTDETDPRDPASLELTFPDGTVLQGDDNRVDAVLSDLTSHPVRLEARSRSYDAAPLHVVTSSSVNALDTGDPIGVAVRRFRPTIVVDTEGIDGFVENDWLGVQLELGDVVIEPNKRTDRCVMVTLDHQDVPARREMLRTVMSRNRVLTREGGKEAPCVGVYAQVSVPGAIHCGDPVARI
ncbi:MOSC domain-containing protein [Rhodococcus sp. NPDC060090]|uniref:MOSC domain-containing protein n=1 Tax=Rhodococcus sp. NPDC060090 TaxID=3347056 RepID=UPI0036492C06